MFRDYDKFISQGKVRIEEELRILSSFEKIYIFGAGVSGKDIYDFLESVELNSKVEAFVDNNSRLYSDKIKGKMVISPKQLFASYTKRDLIVMGTISYEAVINQLNKSYGEGLNYNTTLLFIARTYMENLRSDNLDGKYIKEHSSLYQKVYSQLYDEHSKMTYYNILLSYLTYDSNLLKQIWCDDVQYFPRDIFTLLTTESFCDCGSYDGDTLKIFTEQVKNKFMNYYCIEADAENYKKLSKFVTSLDDNRISLYNKASWSEEALLHFDGENTTSRVSSSGIVQVQADKIDKLLKGKPVTFIKMDIEGAEVNSLLGAVTLIKEQEPILAICIYHSLAEYQTIPNLIKQLNKEYTLYIRHYTKEYNLETVCYAIPNNRLKKENEK